MDAAASASDRPADVSFKEDDDDEVFVPAVVFDLFAVFGSELAVGIILIGFAPAPDGDLCEDIGN